MKKIAVILSILLILISCGGFEFIYKTNKNNFLLTNNMNINANGDNDSEIRVLLTDIFGNNESDPKYKLIVNSSRTKTAAVINKDGTASKFNIQYIASYDLYNLYKNCKTFHKEINTISFYNPKSAGYSFGTDFSEKESNIQNLNKNLNEFVAFLNTQATLDNCLE
jgi:hypothetical protein